MVTELTSNKTLIHEECYYKNNNLIPHDIMYLLQRLLNNEIGGLKSQITLQHDTAQLTEREQQCLCYTTQGYSAKEIANLLYLSPRTIEHLS